MTTWAAIFWQSNQIYSKPAIAIIIGSIHLSRMLRSRYVTYPCIRYYYPADHYIKVVITASTVDRMFRRSLALFPASPASPARPSVLAVPVPVPRASRLVDGARLQ